MKYYATKIKDTGNIAVDDTLLVKGVEATAGSRILEGFKPLFSAEVVERLLQKGYTLSGKTHVGEFGLDLCGEWSAYAEPTAPLRGAAAELVKNGSVKAALSVDINGAPRRAAALSGVDFLKPTYGTVSRYGVISTAASGEAVGVSAADAAGIAEVMKVIAGHDEKDGTSLKNESYDYTLQTDLAGKKVAVVTDLLEKTNEKSKEQLRAATQKLQNQGVMLEEISLDIFEAANTAWQILMTAETCNNLSRYDGVKYGHRTERYKDIDELYVKSRTEGFSFYTKAVILYGSNVLSKNRYQSCYQKALKVRRVMADTMKELFEKYDAVLLPVIGQFSYEPYDIYSAFETVYKESVFTAMANLIGLPALVSGGVQLMGKAFSESDLLSLAAAMEKEGK